MDSTFQRVGATSNAHAGDAFEQIASSSFERVGLVLSRNFGATIGNGNRCKIHKFDLGCDDPAVLVECKSHTWTAGDNIPSAKLTVWNEAMYYFALAPENYRKILFVLRSERAKNRESLAEYYIRLNSHMIPRGVEIWEYNADSDTTVSAYSDILII